MKGNIGKINYINIKNFCSKDTMKGVKSRRYLQYT